MNMYDMICVCIYIYMCIYIYSSRMNLSPKLYRKMCVAELTEAYMYIYVCMHVHVHVRVHL